MAESLSDTEKEEPSLCTGLMLFRKKRDASSDTFYKLLEAKVRSIQYATRCDTATKIQEAIAENLKYFLKEVEKLEPLFFVSELIQVGSFAEGTKIYKPDEFDFLAVVDVLSKEGTVTVEHDGGAGSVSVSLSEKYSNSTLTKLCEEGKVKCFQAPSLALSFSGPARFGTIFVQTVVNAYKSKVFEFRRGGQFTVGSPVGMDFVRGGLVIPPVNGIPLLLKKIEFKTPNVLLEYKCGELSIGVDLSPAIRYHGIENCVSEKCANPKLMETIQKHGSVLLVGDKVGGFRITVTECEVKYMQDLMKEQHKLLYILFKHVSHTFKESISSEIFSSYMLKQVCLHHDAKCQSDTEKCSDCFEMIIADMIKYCAERHLPSVLNKDIGLFNPFSSVSGRNWHLKLHFLIALRAICQRSRNISNIEEFEAVLCDSINQSAKKFTDFHEATGLMLHIPLDKFPSLNTKENDGLYCPICDETSG